MHAAFAESTWVLFAEMKSCPQGMDFRLMVQGFSLSPSFSSISTTTSLHVFQVGRQDSMNLMPLHRPSRFGPRSNRCKHEFQRVRRLPTIGELTTRTKNKDNHYPLSPESCRVPWTENNNWRTYIRMYVWWLGVYTGNKVIYSILLVAILVLVIY